MHADYLRASSVEDARSLEALNAILANAPEAPLDEGDRALLALALKMTREPGPMGPELVERLRALGFDDVAILEAANLIGFFNYINRVVDALGVPLEDRRPQELRALARW